MENKNNNCLECANWKLGVGTDACKTCENKGNFVQKGINKCPDCIKYKQCLQARTTSCLGFEQKTCGNCDWHGEHEYPLNKEQAKCGWSMSAILTDTHKAEYPCQWKPIEPVCKRCNDTGKVLCGCHLKEEIPCPECNVIEPLAAFTLPECEVCGGIKKILKVNKINYKIGGHEWECPTCKRLYTYKHDAQTCCGANRVPCPTCQIEPEKEEQLIMSMRWEENCQHGEQLVFREVGWTLASFYFEKDKYHVDISAGAFGKLLLTLLTHFKYKTASQAKAAVEKALGIKREG